MADLSSRYPRYAQLSALPPAKSGHAQQLRGAGEVFVSYLLHSDGGAQVFVLDQSGSARWLDLGKLPNHRDTVAAYRELLSPSRPDSARGRLVGLKAGGYQWLMPGQAPPAQASAAAASAAEALGLLKRYWHDKLIAPVLPLAGGYARWIVSPDRDLALLPFDTLPETLDAGSRSSRTLGEQRILTVVQSFAVYALLKQRETEYAELPRTKDLFAMGNAVYGNGWAAGRGMQRGGGTPGFQPKGRSATAFPPSQSASAPSAEAEQYTLSQGTWVNLNRSPFSGRHEAR